MYTIFCIIFAPFVIGVAIKMANDMNRPPRRWSRGRGRRRR